MRLNPEERKSILYLWSLVVLVMIIMPLPETEGVKHFTYIDKIVHLVLFGIFVYLLILSLSSVKKLSFYAVYAISLIIGLTYALLGEMLQYFIPGRSPSIWDLLSGFSGILLAMALLLRNKNQ